MDSYKNKYLKYKNKYLNLKQISFNQIGGKKDNYDKIIFYALRTYSLKKNKSTDLKISDVVLKILEKIKKEGEKMTDKEIENERKKGDNIVLRKIKELILKNIKNNNDKKTFKNITDEILSEVVKEIWDEKLNSTQTGGNNISLEQIGGEAEDTIKETLIDIYGTDWIKKILSIDNNKLIEVIKKKEPSLIESINNDEFERILNNLKTLGNLLS
jgi:hypothetical protein